MLPTASFAPPPNSASLNDRLESGLRIWVAAARAQLNQAVPSTDVLGNVMNQGIHLHAVSARLLEAAECAGQLAVNTAAGARGPLRTAMQEMGQAERLWGSVTTAMPPSHEYVEAARELQAALTDVAHDGPHPRDANEITQKIHMRRALGDLRYAAHDVADLARDVQHLPGQLARSELLFAPASKLTPSVERLHERAAGRYVSLLPDEIWDLANAAGSAAWRTNTAVRTLDRALGQAFPLAVAKACTWRTASVPEL